MISLNQNYFKANFIMSKIEELLELLVCPLTKEKLEYNQETNELISKKANLAYPIVNGIPVMLKEKAREIN